MYLTTENVHQTISPMKMLQKVKRNSSSNTIQGWSSTGLRKRVIHILKQNKTYRICLSSTLTADLFDLADLAVALALSVGDLAEC